MDRLCINCKHYEEPVGVLEGGHCLRDDNTKVSPVTGQPDNRLRDTHLCFYERLGYKSLYEKFLAMIGIHTRCGTEGYYFLEKDNVTSTDN